MTARTAVPVARPKRRNIAAEAQRVRRRRGGASVWGEEVGWACGALGEGSRGGCCSRCSREEVEKQREWRGARLAGGGRRDTALCWGAARAADRV